MTSEILDLHSALAKLGIKGTITTRQISAERIAVWVNGEYFGIWDTARKTFVD